MIDITFGGSFSPRIMAAAITTLGVDIRSFREPLKRSVQQVMAPAIKANFEAEGRPPWEPLSVDTLRQKDALGYGGKKTLERTGKLKRVSQQLNAWTISSNDAEILDLPGVPYWQFHESGTQNMPARPFLSYTDDDADKIQDVFGDWFMERALAAGVIARLV